jgi:hypothetical protein
MLFEDVQIITGSQAQRTIQKGRLTNKCKRTGKAKLKWKAIGKMKLNG